jgi:membrane protein DedA with SNARE-associated domain
VVANLPACALWSTVYAGIGLAGGSIFPEAWQGVLAAIVVILVVNQSISRWNKRREARRVAPVTK